MQSGAAGDALPSRDAAGRLEIGAEHGLVMVLVPAGFFRMAATAVAGAHNFDPGARDEELPVHRLHLGADFISKYEMTQAQ